MFLCPTCLSQAQLSTAGLSFLLDELDTVLAYENKGKSNELSHQGHDPLMSALDNLNRVQQLEIIHGKQDRTDRAMTAMMPCSCVDSTNLFQATMT